jgi:ArsR family metal-binding transcriptional regulator
VLEKLVNNQLTDFLDVYSVLSGMQSGFCSGYGCITVTLKVLNDAIIALDSKQCCTAIFIDLAKALIL